MSSSKTDNKSVADDVRQWLPPDINGGKVSSQRTVQPPSAPPTAVELEKLQKAAYEEGFEQGRKEGFEYGHKEGLEQSRKQLQHYTTELDRLLKTFEHPLTELDNQLERELLSLVTVSYTHLTLPTTRLV